MSNINTRDEINSLINELMNFDILIFEGMEEVYYWESGEIKVPSSFTINGDKSCYPFCSDFRWIYIDTCPKCPEGHVNVNCISCNEFYSEEDLVEMFRREGWFSPR